MQYRLQISVQNAQTKEIEVACSHWYTVSMIGLVWRHIFLSLLFWCLKTFSRQGSHAFEFVSKDNEKITIPENEMRTLQWKIQRQDASCD